MMTIEYFGRIIKHYIRLALTSSGIKLNSDVRAELHDATESLEQGIRDMISQQMREHLRNEHGITEDDTPANEA